MVNRNRRRFLAGMGSGLLASACSQKAPALSLGDETTKKPNIVLIVMDQERAWHTLPDGFDMPVRRKFADAAMNFTNYHVNSVPCAPSRAIIWTGQHTQFTGVIANPGHAGSRELSAAETPTIPGMLKAFGYKTALKGKWHLSDLSHLKGKGQLDALTYVGYDEWQETPDTFGRANEAAAIDTDIAASAVEYLERQAQDSSDQPWFLTINFIHPHDVMWFDATGEQRSTRLRPGYVSNMVDAPPRAPFLENLALDLPNSFYAEPSEWPYAQTAYKKINDVFYGFMPEHEMAYRLVQNFYLNCLRDSEQNLERVFNSLERLGLADNTIVILTSDHGEMAGAHRQRNKGPFMYKENLNVPLVIKDPRTDHRGQSDAVCSSLDLAPTILNLAGVQTDDIQSAYPALKGTSLRSVVEGSQASTSAFDDREILIQFNSLTHTNPRIFAERIIDSGLPIGERLERRWPDDDAQFEIRGFGRGVFDGRYKFCRWFSPADHHQPTDWYELIARNDVELIDTLNDPDEVINLAARPLEYRDIIMEMNAKLNAIITREVGVDDGSYLPGESSIWTG